MCSSCSIIRNTFLLSLLFAVNIDLQNDLSHIKFRINIKSVTVCDLRLEIACMNVYNL